MRAVRGPAPGPRTPRAIQLARVLSPGPDYVEPLHERYGDAFVLPVASRPGGVCGFPLATATLAEAMEHQLSVHGIHKNSHDNCHYCGVGNYKPATDRNRIANVRVSHVATHEDRAELAAEGGDAAEAE